MFYVIDRQGSLSNCRRTPIGGLLVDATLARTGVLEYPNHPARRQYNPPDVLQAALDDLTSIPVTYQHPKHFVTPESYRDVSAGHVVGAPSFDGKYLRATLAIQDADLIEAIERKEVREVSMGYRVALDATPGTTPDGEAFDAARTGVEWNHIAIVPAGRAGKNVQLMLDSAEIPEEDRMKLKINGKEVDADKAQAAIDALEGESTGRIAALEKDLEDAKARAAEAEEKLADALKPENIQKLVADAREAEKALAEKAARREAVAKAFPKVALDGKSEEFIDGLYAGLQADPDGIKALRGETTQTVVDKKEPAPAVDPRQQMLASTQDSWKQKL